jgi:hypothetical protein
MKAEIYNNSGQLIVTIDADNIITNDKYSDTNKILHENAVVAVVPKECLVILIDRDPEV